MRPRPTEKVDGESLRLPVLERLVRTMRTNPRKLEGLRPLIEDLGADGALPEGFALLWETIGEVAFSE